MILELKNISKQFKINRNENFSALENISLSFNKGEFVAILGASGSGKSTLLNIIAGLDYPSSGELFIDEKSTLKFKEKQWDFIRKNNIGFVFQQFNLIEHLNALENVEIVMSLTGQKKSYRKKRAYELLEKVGISKEHALHLPSELSGGQKQRVAIARALANDPDIILADEPTGALDKKTGILIMDLLKEIASDKLIILVTHNQNIAYQYSSKVIKMADGAIIEQEILKESLKVEKTSILKKKDSKMPFREAFKLSLRNMKQKFGRVFITALAGSIGIAGIALVLGLGAGANQFIDDQIVRFGSSNVLVVSKTTKDKNGKLKELNNIKYFKFIKENENVVSLRKQLTSLGTWNLKDEALDLQSSALADSENQKFLQEFLIGRLPKEGKNEIIINQSLARSIMDILNLDRDTTKYEKILNRKIELDLKSSGFSGKKSFKVVGIVEEIDVNQNFLYYNYNDMKDFYQNTDFYFDNVYDLTMDNVTKYEVVIDNPNKMKEVRNWILVQENQDTSIVAVSNSMFNTSEGINITSFALTFQFAINTIILMGQYVMIAFLAIALIVSSILIAIVLFSSILERKVEIGILKAVGARKKDVMRIFQSEAILIGLFSGLLGISASFGLAFVIERIVTSFSEYNIIGIIKIPISMNVPFLNIDVFLLPLLLLILLSVVVSFIAGYIPSRRATKMKVIDALRDE